MTQLSSSSSSSLLPSASTSAPTFQPSPLFLKPASGSLHNWRVHIPGMEHQLIISCLDPLRDIPELHQWVNAPYAQRFWNAASDQETLRGAAENLLMAPNTHAFTARIGGQLIGQIEVYAAATDAIAPWLTGVTEGDCGIHLLMCPARQMKRGWSYQLLTSFQSFYFSFPQARRLLAEPDIHNGPANKLAMKAGFQFLKSIRLSNKTANLYCIDRETFYLR